MRSFLILGYPHLMGVICGVPLLCACTHQVEINASEVAYDSSESQLAVEDVQAAIDLLSRSTLSEAVVGDWEGSLISVDVTNGAIQIIDGLWFRFEAPGDEGYGSYESNLDEVIPEESVDDRYNVRGRYYAVGDRALAMTYHYTYAGFQEQPLANAPAWVHGDTLSLGKVILGSASTSVLHRATSPDTER